ncbi:MAG: CoA transferase, partial [Chloroflexi bacterium]|nr:CoA transferase [Chloroflexota bacterium]
TLSALHYRDITGIGQYIDMSEIEALLCGMPEAIMEYTMNQRVPQPRGNRDEVMAPHGCYRCKGEDHWLAIAVSSDEEWESLCKVMGKPELIRDKRFQDGFLRWKNQDDMDKIIAEWASQQNYLEAFKQLQKAGVASGPVYNTEALFSDPQLRAREFFVEIEHPEVGKRELSGVFAKLSETPGAVRRHDPLFGEHNNWLLNELLADVEIKKQS